MASVSVALALELSPSQHLWQREEREEREEKGERGERGRGRGGRNELLNCISGVYILVLRMKL